MAVDGTTRHPLTGALAPLLTAALAWFPSQATAAQCALPADEGNASVSGTFNSYWRPADGTYNDASTAIPISSPRPGGATLAPDDLVLLMQMQCADIDFSDTQSYGDGNGT
ncbi:MAG: hypothetical protein AAGE01_22220, partial [Pseudomonadota bacterium]